MLRQADSMKRNFDTLARENFYIIVVGGGIIAVAEETADLVCQKLGINVQSSAAEGLLITSLFFHYYKGSAVHFSSLG